MNIVKGVADLIWRGSSGQSGEYGSGSPSGRFSAPTPKITFSEEGDEAILKVLWERYVNSDDEVEKRKSLHIFLKQFLTIFRNWKPLNLGQSLEQSVIPQPVEFAHDVVDMVVGCNIGHPAEIILMLTEELSQITRLLTDNQVGVSSSMNISNESWITLDALTVVTLSIHNCKVFGYYGGIQKLTALMKAAVVQLKTIASALSADESLLNTMVQNAGILQKILVHVVSIICNFIDPHSSTEENILLESTKMESSAAGSGKLLNYPSAAARPSLSETILPWHQTTVVSIMEAGGLNWLLEILRLIRRLIMKEQWADMSLQHLTLRALRLALADNPRGQNHFRSIGGLEVLLDGLAVPSVDSLIADDSSNFEERSKQHFQDVFSLHVLSLEVLKEATFGNFNNLQFLCENGRVQKFANSFCSVAFMLQDYKRRKDLSEKDNVDLEGRKTHASEAWKQDLFPLYPTDPSFLHQWKEYVAKMSAALCCFLLGAKGTESRSIQTTISRSTVLASSVYAELSVRWFTRVLLTVFPCIKASY